MIDEPEERVPQDEWLTLAQDAYQTGNNFYEWSLRNQLARNLDNFRSKHPRGSKYYTDAYRHRSKIYRPKIRASIRHGESMAAVAFFATADGVSVSAENPASEEQRLAAELHKNVVNYRLENTIPWFLTCIGAYQDAMVQGVVISRQYWEYQEKESEENELVERDIFIEGGNIEGEGIEGEGIEGEEPYMEQAPSVEVIKDYPCIELEPVENIRIDPAANWIDPINSSPYVIRMVPMYVGDIKSRMMETDRKTGQPKWRQLTEDQIATSVKHSYDSVRQSREGERPDSKESQNKGRVKDFDIAWCHENFIRKDGREWVYWTLGTEALLTDPKPLEEVYRHCDDGKRPLVMGYSVLETHKVYPSGIPQLAENLSVKANEIENLRIDNIRLALSPRHLIRRQAAIDYRALTRAVPGAGVLVSDINADVKEMRPSDVTGSSYQEQDRTNLDIDELLGTFSQGSVQSNRQLNETVGGLNLLSNSANTMAEYQLRVFTETWVEPVLRQLVKMERAYETDEVILLTAGQELGIQNLEQADAVLSTGELKVRVNVGFGATSPHLRVQRMQMGLSVIASVMPDVLTGLDAEEIIKEIFGALGYKDGARFFKFLQGNEDPQVAQLTEQLQQMQALLEGKQMDYQAQMQLEQMRQQGRMAETQLKEASKMQIAEMQAQLKVIDSKITAAKAKADQEIELEKLFNQRAALVHQMRLKASEMLQANQQGTMSQTLMNDKYNMVPGKVG